MLWSVNLAMSSSIRRPWFTILAAESGPPHILHEAFTLVRYTLTSDKASPSYALPAKSHFNDLRYISPEMRRSTSSGRSSMDLPAWNTQDPLMTGWSPVSFSRALHASFSDDMEDTHIQSSGVLSSPQHAIRTFSPAIEATATSPLPENGTLCQHSRH